jgi:signal peptidase I
MSKLFIMLAAIALSPGLQQAQAPTYAKGDVVTLVRPASGDPYPDSRVMAIPGDRLQARRSGILVNGEPVKDVSPGVLEQFVEPWEQVVPPGHYFVIGEKQAGTSAVLYFGLIPSEKIVRKVK